MRLCGNFKPVSAKVKERDDEDEEEERAVDAWALEDVGCGEEEEEVEGWCGASVGRFVSGD